MKDRIINLIFFGAAILMLALVVRVYLDQQDYAKLDSVIKLNSADGSGGYGTGFMTVYKSKKYVISAGHVCDKNLMMVTNLGQVLKVLYATSSPVDICVMEPHPDLKLKINKLSLQEVKFGDFVHFTGYNQGNANFPALNQGRILESDTFINMEEPLPLPDTEPNFESEFDALMWLMQHMAVQTYVVKPLISAEITLDPGNSGSPLLNYKDEVIGVAVITRRRDRIGYFIKTSALIKILEEQSWQK